MQHVRKNLATLNPDAIIIEAASPVSVEDPGAVTGKRVLVIKDGPTLTHGDIAFGAGWIAAERFGAVVVDPRPFAVGRIAAMLKTYKNAGSVLPAVGYGEEQLKDLAITINKIPCDLVLIATPFDLQTLIEIAKPCQRVTYELQKIGKPTLRCVLREKLAKEIPNLYKQVPRARRRYRGS